MSVAEKLSTTENSFGIDNVKSLQKVNEDVLFIHDLREVSNLSTIRMEYNTFVYCRGGRILVEIGGDTQIKVKPGQLLLVPAGKLVQPMMISADIDAHALLLTEKILKSALGNQLDIWNKAMYMKETYIVKETGWLEGVAEYSQKIFPNDKEPKLYNEMVFAFLRMLLLLLCEELMRSNTMFHSSDSSTIHDKVLFNQFLLHLSQQEQKRQKVSFYADKLNITPKYLSTITKRVSGKNPMRWITESVMDDCYRLLTSTDLSVKEISNRLGFPNSSFFGQYFRNEAGMTPMEYRTGHKRWS
ncbi:MAG: helix-turn-helix domain-containing protein [Prevotella sp.]|nr:helix-turn-helix domain-containing protein [Prevotella sp.]